MGAAAGLDATGIEDIIAGGSMKAQVEMAKIEQIDPNEQLWRDLEKADGDGSAARAVLAAGHPIYYGEDDTPQGLLIKEYPDGRRELVRVRREGDEVIRVL